MPRPGVDVGETTTVVDALVELGRTGLPVHVGGPGCPLVLSAGVTGEQVAEAVRLLARANDAIGLRVAGLRIDGDVVLVGLESYFPVALTEATGSWGLRLRAVSMTGWDLTGSSLTSVDLMSCTFRDNPAQGGRDLGFLTLRRCLVTGDVDLLQVDVHGRTDLSAMRVAGGARVNGSVTTSGGVAMDLRTAGISGRLWLDDLRLTGGHLDGSGMQVGAGVQVEGCEVVTPGRMSFRLDRVLVQGDLAFGEGCDAGLLHMGRSTVTGSVDLVGCELYGAGGLALNLARVRIGGDLRVSLSTLGGAFVAYGCDIAGRVSLSHGTVGYRTPLSMSLDRTRVGGDVALGPGLQSTGQLRLTETTVRGRVTVADVAVTTGSWPALVLEGGQIGGLDLADPDAFEGRVVRTDVVEGQGVAPDGETTSGPVATITDPHVHGTSQAGPSIKDRRYRDFCYDAVVGEALVTPEYRRELHGYLDAFLDDFHNGPFESFVVGDHTPFVLRWQVSAVLEKAVRWEGPLEEDDPRGDDQLSRATYAIMRLFQLYDGEPESLTRLPPLSRRRRPGAS